VKYTIFWADNLKVRDHGRPSYRWEDNIRIDPRDIGWKIVG
jgi:hypothetical protein